MVRAFLILTLLASAGFAADPPSATQTFTNSIGMAMVWMGEGYWVGKFEVTQKEYQAVTGKNPSKFKAERNPVERVSWHDAMAFCKALTEKERAAGTLPKGFVYSLPTEKQWDEFVGDSSLND